MQLATQIGRNLGDGNDTHVDITAARTVIDTAAEKSGACPTWKLRGEIVSQSALLIGAEAHRDLAFTQLVRQREEPRCRFAQRSEEGLGIVV